MNFNKNLIVVFLFPFILFGQGGWEYQNFSPGNLKFVCFVDSLTGWAVGDEELIQTTDGGKSWKYQEISNPKWEHKNSILFKNRNLGWVVGVEIYNTNDGGEHWSKQERGTSQNRNFELRSVFFYNERIGWASGDSSLILRTTDGGLNWQSQSVGGKFDIVSSIYFIDSLRGWAVKEKEILQSTNSGESWNKIYTVNVNYLNSIFFLDSLNGWTAGYGGVIFSTTDGGKNWYSSVVVDYQDLHFSSVYFLDLNNGFIVGSYQDSFFKEYPLLFKTTDNGKNWTSPNFNYDPSEVLDVCFSSIIFTNNKTGWIVGCNSLIYTTNGGSDWINHNSMMEGNGILTSVDFVNEKTGWAVGFDGNILKTTDGGENWNQTFRDRQMSDVCFIDENIGWIVGDETILYTTDGGNNWNEQTAPWHTGQIKSVHFIDVENGWSVGWFDPILKTTDGGQNWKASTSEQYSLRDVVFLNEDYGWACGETWIEDSLQHSKEFGQIIRTTNGGAHWDEYKLEGCSFNSIHFVDTNIGWVTGTNLTDYTSILLKTIDGGITWRTITVDESNLFKIFFINKNIGWVTTGFESGKILHSIDGGENWSEQFSSYRSFSTLSAIKFINEKTGWAVGSYGTILKTSNGGVTFVEVDNNSLAPTNFLLYQNYPNPFNPNTKISWQSPVGSQQTLKVYDILGNEIATLVNEEKPAGKYEVNFDASKLASGVYYYRLQADSFVETKKMMVLK